MDASTINLKGYHDAKLGKIVRQILDILTIAPCLFSVGRGTQGSVFKAYQNSGPKTPVAIKVSP